MIKMVKSSFAINLRTISTLSGLKMLNQGLRSKLEKRPQFTKKSLVNSKRSMKKRRKNIRKLSRKPNKRPLTTKGESVSLTSEKIINLVTLKKVETSEIASHRSHTIEEVMVTRRNRETILRVTGTIIEMNTTTGAKMIIIETGIMIETIEGTTTEAIITSRMTTAGAVISLLVKEIKGSTKMIIGRNIETSLDLGEMTIGEGKGLVLHMMMLIKGRRE